MPAPENGNGDGAPPAFKRALRDLVAALYAKKVEPICTAYLALRRASRGLVVRELLARITAAGGVSAVPTIVSAFAHRKCFMCEDGTTSCQTCDGTGMVDRFPCPQCEGLMLEPCSFCLGTGWSDQADMPDEIRRAVYLRQAAHVERDTLRLAAVGDEASRTAGQVPADGRRELAAWLIRLQSRLVRLVSSDADGDDQAARFGSVVARIETLLKALRPPLQTGEPSPEELPPGA